jgi:ubiquinone/menaquinone biosynthesis C-methylase UbiE
MTIHTDPERNEVRALQAAASWRGKRVLEIGSGDGRLARRLARLGSSVTASDPNETLLKKLASSFRPASFRVRCCSADGRYLAFAKESCDISVFGWSL